MNNPSPLSPQSPISGPSPLPEKGASPYTSILLEVKTTHDTDVLFQAIASLLASLYRVDKRVFDTIIAGLPYTLSTVVSETLQKHGLSWTNPGKMKEFLEGLQDTLKKCRVINLTIAFEPTLSSIDTFRLFTKQQLGADVVIEVTTDPHVLGGAIVTFEGHFVDASLRKKLSVFFEKYKQTDQNIQK